MWNLHNHTPQQPAGCKPTGNQGSGTSFQVSEIMERDSWYSEMFSNFCLPASVMVLFIKDNVWVDSFVRTMIFRQALRLLQELWTASRLSQQPASALKGRVFGFPFSLLAFIITACIEDVVWKERFVWAIMHLVVVHLTVQVLRVHLEPIERALEPILHDFLSEQLPWYMPTRPTAMPAAKVENQSSRTSFGVLPVPIFYLAFHSMQYYNHDLNDRHMWAMILVFTFYTGRQAFRLILELRIAKCLSQQHAPALTSLDEADNQCTGKSFMALEVVRRGLLDLRVLDMPFSLLAFIIMVWMDDGNWKDRYLGAIMSLLLLSTILQLVHLFLAILAVLRYLKKHGSLLTSLASDLPSRTLTESMITQVASSSTLPSTSLTMSTITQRASSSNLPSMSSKASTITQPVFSSSRPRWTYDVFLSFHGEDCRKKFADHLYTALKQKGILVYRDNENLERGKYIVSELLEAIQKSEYAVVVISKNYAFSKWCLMELTHIMNCMIETQLTVLPVFYHVDPSHVRNQIGSFADAFDKHMKNLKVVEEERKAWRVALEKVGGLAGWHVHDRYEAEVVKDICRTIFIRLCGNLSNFSNNLVGMKSRVENMINLLEMDGVNFIGICGIGGIGKTTLAKFIYDRFSSEFEASSFIYVKEGTQNEVDLQRQLISEIFKESGIEVLDTCERFRILRKVCNKKVLIVFDNVEEEAQIKEFVWRRDLHHQGSRILITSKNRQLLKRYVDQIYDVEELDHIDALQLFSLMAFKKSRPKENYLKMSHDLVKYAEGIPLAVEIFGSSLFEKQMDVWKSALDHFKSHPNAKIVDKLEVSLKGLEVVQKQIFLDVIFFFNGSPKSEVIDILDSCGYCPAFNISVLRDKCLIKISEDNTIRVHDLLVIMGQQIVNNESLEEPCRRSRLCHQKDIISIMKKNIVTNMVEGIVLELPLEKREQLSLEAFSKMTNLRILLIKNKSCYLETSSNFLEDLQTLEWERDHSNFNLSNKLCVITWWRYPLQSLPSSFQSDNLVKLQMPHSCIKKLWDGLKSFGKLKEIDLRYSKNLIETPDFGGAPNLEKLVLSFCTNLSTVHSSIIFLKHLQVLNLEGCNCLEELPESENGLECLEKVDIRGTAIRKLTSILFSTKLKILNVGGNESNPTSFLLPKSFSSFSSLEELNLSYCNISDGRIFNGLDYLPSLTSLDLKGNKFMRLPDSISQLSNLKALVLDNCSNLQVLPKLPVILVHFSVRNCTLLEKPHSQMDAWTSSEMLLTGDFSTLAVYAGYSGKPYMNIYLHPQRCLTECQWALLEGVSWGVTQGSKIPKWFNQRSTDSYGTIQTQIIVDDHSTGWVGYALFIVYQVHELDICQREIKNQNAHEYESSNSGTYDGSNPIFPEFVCQLQVNEVGPGPYHEFEDLEDSDFLTESAHQLEPNDVGAGPSHEFESSEDSDFHSEGARQLELNEVGPAPYDKFENSCFRTKNAPDLELNKGGPVRYREFENSRFRTKKAQKLEFNKGGPGLSFVFRIPEDVPVGSNGVWVFINWWCFKKVCASIRRRCLGVSITSKSPNVKVKECGARLVTFYDDSEFEQVVNSISPQGLDEISLGFILSPGLVVQSF